MRGGRGRDLFLFPGMGGNKETVCVDLDVYEVASGYECDLGCCDGKCPEVVTGCKCKCANEGEYWIEQENSSPSRFWRSS